MKSQGLVKGWRAVLLMVACCTLLAVVAQVPAGHDYSARTKPTERCVPKHPYAGEQPECWRYLP
jgi:predicted MFS family arabinose efflux permease